MRADRRTLEAGGWGEADRASKSKAERDSSSSGSRRPSGSGVASGGLAPLRGPLRKSPTPGEEPVLFSPRSARASLDLAPQQQASSPSRQPAASLGGGSGRRESLGSSSTSSASLSPRRDSAAGPFRIVSRLSSKDFKQDEDDEDTAEPPQEQQPAQQRRAAMRRSKTRSEDTRGHPSQHSRHSSDTQLSAGGSRGSDDFGGDYNNYMDDQPGGVLQPSPLMMASGHARGSGRQRPMVMLQDDGPPSGRKLSISGASSSHATSPPASLAPLSSARRSPMSPTVEVGPDPRMRQQPPMVRPLTCLACRCTDGYSSAANLLPPFMLAAGEVDVSTRARPLARQPLLHLRGPAHLRQALPALAGRAAALHV